MTNTRRSFLARSAALAVSSPFAGSILLPRALHASNHATRRVIPSIGDPDLKSLLQGGLDTARSAGATYADIRFTHTRERGTDGRFSVGDSEAITVGVRALVEGYWGFASGPVWSSGEIARLAREAVLQGKTNALGKPRRTELAPVSPIPDGHWTMPVAIDPFAVHPAQIWDMLDGLSIYARRRGAFAASYRATFQTQDKSFGSTDGTYLTQRTYRSAGEFELTCRHSDGRTDMALIDRLTPAGVGLELFDERMMRDAIDRSIEEMRADFALPVNPVDVGRYDTILTAQSVATLLSGTIGAATELDRALGYESNAGGTSYLNDPIGMLGTYVVGAPALSVRANRDDTGAVATVQWDDDGVKPQSFPLVTRGVVADYHTTREAAGWLKDSYTKQGTAFQSHGCSYAPSAIDAPLAHTANLVMAPGAESLDFETSIKSMKKGLAFKNVNVSLDFQQLNGFALGRCYEIVNGQRTAILANAGILFRAPQLWKSIISIGGNASARRFGMRASKGQPSQSAYHSVTAVPSIFEKLTIIDVLRKA